MRVGVEMGMAVVKSVRWGGDGYGGGEECEVGWRWVWRWLSARWVEMGLAVVKSAVWVEMGMAVVKSGRRGGDGYGGGEEWEVGGDGYGGGEECEVVWRWVWRW